MQPRFLRVLLAAATALALLAAPAGVVASERHPGQLEVERLVMCTTCGRSLDVSSGPSAERERAFIRRQIAAGHTRQEVLDAVVAEHGGDTTVLSVPPRDSTNGRIAWLGPLVVAGLLVLAGLGTVWRWRRRGQRAGVAGASAAPELAASDQRPAPDVRLTDSQ
jgi:cytochrome c-type biogenesis protein CcmH/NrfF